ncbi:Na/Pi symporter, partial [Desulfobulbus sp. N3]|nr:Na/Pi symporter [Desulfobulbus sp. N3]
MATNIDKILDKIPASALALACLTVLIPAGPLWAGNNNDAEGISWVMLFLGITGGLAFFLYGMELMSEGLKKTAGNKMRSILAALTKNRFIGLLMGAFVTTVIQSSSATTVMLVSFVQAELMTFAQSLGVILGADILLAHCEHTPSIQASEQRMRERFGEHIPAVAHPLIRDAEACYRSSSLAVELAKRHGTRLHVLHITSARELVLFEDKPLAEKRITAEVCLHHLLFD